MLKKLLIATGVLAILLLVAGWLLLGVFVYPGEDSHSGRTALVNGQFITMTSDDPRIVRDRAIEGATRQLADPDEARAVVDRLVEEGVDLIKVIYTAGRSGTLPRMQYDVLEAIVDRAHRRGTRVVVHTDSRSEVEDALRAGADGQEHLALDLGEDADQLLERLAEQEVVIVPTLTVIRDRVFDDGSASVAGTFSRWLDHDIPVALGTDAGNLPAGESVYDEIGLLVEAGMTPYEALGTATIGSARHAGLDDVLGTLEPGKHADVVVFDQNPLDRIRDLGLPKMVFKEGTLMVDRR